MLVHKKRIINRCWGIKLIILIQYREFKLGNIPDTDRCFLVFSSDAVH